MNLKTIPRRPLLLYGLPVLVIGLALLGLVLFHRFVPKADQVSAFPSKTILIQGHVSRSDGKSPDTIVISIAGNGSRVRADGSYAVVTKLQPILLVAFNGYQSNDKFQIKGQVEPEIVYDQENTNKSYDFVVDYAGTSSDTSPTPTPTPNPLAATINSFTVNKPVISTSTVVSLYYNVTNVKSAAIDNGLGSLAISNNSAVGNKNITLSKTTTFTLTVVGLDGKTVTKQQTVTFSTAKPPTPTITSTVSDPITIQLNWTLPVALTTTGDGITLTRTNPDGTSQNLTVSNAATNYTDTNLTPAFNNQTNNYKYSISIKHNGVSSDSAITIANLTLSSDTVLLSPGNFTIKKASSGDKLTWNQKGVKPLGYLLMDGKVPLRLLSGSTTTTTMSLTSGHTVTLYGYNKQPAGFSASVSVSAKAP